MATRRKTEAKEAPAFSKEQLLTFAKYRERRDLLGVLLEDEQRYTYDEVDALMNDFMKGKVK
ncbi:MAG: hypothetical protein ACLTWR_08160 [Agathobaculum desmolans]|uniref:hypothetical protein n=1 Tax=Agathobaculum desmolans TaxID=39484 RepID=UPI003996B59C